MSEVQEPLLHNSADEEAALPAKRQGSWMADLKDITLLAGPAILQLSFQQAVIVTNQSMAGHLGPDELAAAAISVTWFNLLWFFLLGVTSALDTLASQAFGANDRPGVVSWGVTATAVMSLMAVPMGVALWFADDVAGFVFAQPSEICDLVEIYCKGIIPGLLPFIWSLIIMKVMQAQNLMWGPTLVTIGMFISNIFVNLVFIHYAGFTGAAYAQSASRIALFLFLLVYVRFIDNTCIQFDRPAWVEVVEGDEDVSTTREIADALEAASAPDSATTVTHDTGSSPNGKKYVSEDGGTDEDPPFSTTTVTQVVKEGLTPARLKLFTQLGVSGGLMMAADASSFDITTAMAGYIGVEEVGAHTALLTLVEFIYTSFPYGIATAATIRVGNMLGAGNARSARQSAYLCLAGCGCFNLTMMILLFVFGGEIGYIFTNDPQVVAIVKSLSFFAAIYQIPDCIFGSVSGILRGTGRQAELMWANLAGFWGVGMPICYTLAFRFGWGVEGLWVGLVVGLSCSATLVLIMLLRVDWEADAEKAQLMAVQHAESEEDEAAGGDTFAVSQIGTGAPPATPFEAMDESPEVAPVLRPVPVAHRPIPIQRSSSGTSIQRAHSIGSLTGSYARQMNSHL